MFLANHYEANILMIGVEITDNPDILLQFFCTKMNFCFVNFLLSLTQTHLLVFEIEFWFHLICDIYYFSNEIF